MIVRCIHSKGKLPPCCNAGCPDGTGVLTHNDMIVLGYIKCDIDNKHYLANADRLCKYFNQ